MKSLRKENTMTKESRKNAYYPRLRELRVAAGLNQMEVSNLLDMQQNQYSRYERGDREMPMHLFIVLARYYNVSIDYMVGITDTREQA